MFPRPHSPVFDFEATQAGAEWIEDLAARAAAIVARDAAGPTVLTHVDFRVEHLRVDGDELVAVYDWDSLCVDHEAVAVGQVAHVFTIDWSQPVAHVPTLEEATAFVEDYEQARGHPFDDREWRVAAGRVGVRHGLRRPLRARAARPRRRPGAGGVPRPTRNARRGLAPVTSDADRRSVAWP